MRGVAFYACRCLRLEEGEALVYRHSSVSFQCLKQYVELLIKEGLETAISCPDAACPKQGQLQDSEARAGVTGFGGVLAGVSRAPCPLTSVTSRPSACHTPRLYFFPLRSSVWSRLK